MSGPAAAMVLAAGLGTRMRPLTDRLPKPLIPVAGRPLIDRALDHVAAAGVPRAVVNLHYLAPMLRAHLAGRVAPQVAFSDETARLLDTGGGVRQALPMLGPVFFVLNSDAIWTGSNPLATLAAAWAPGRMDALLLLVGRDRARTYTRAGDFHLGADGLPVRRGAAPTAAYVYTGAAIMTAAAFAHMPEGPFSLNLPWDRLLATGRLAAVVHPGVWVDVGTPDGIAAAETALAS